MDFLSIPIPWVQSTKTDTCWLTLSKKTHKRAKRAMQQRLSTVALVVIFLSLCGSIFAQMLTDYTVWPFAGKHLLLFYFFLGKSDATPGAGDNGAPVDAGMNPIAIAVSANGNAVYIAELSRIRMVNRTTNIITTIAGGSLVGSAEGNGVPALQAKFATIADIKLDQSKNLLYIADLHCVRVINLVTQNISTLAGHFTENLYAGDGGPAILARFSTIKSLAMDSSRQLLYISDSANRRVRMVNITSGNVSTVVGTGATTGGEAITGVPPLQTTFTTLGVIAIAQGANHLYIEDNNLVRMVNFAQNVITTKFGNRNAFGRSSTVEGPAEITSASPIYMVFNPSETVLYFVERTENRIRQYNVSNQYIYGFAGKFKFET